MGNHSNKQKSLWRDRLKVLQSSFPSPWREEKKDRAFENSFNKAISLLDEMKHSRVFQDQKAWQGYLGDPVLPDYSNCEEALLNDTMTPMDTVIEELVQFFQGMPNWNHPQTMANVSPPSNTASVIGSMLSQIYNPNIIEGDYSWNIGRTELESIAMMSHMVGWDPTKTSGIYTFGGTGCYLYGLKYALTSVLGKETRSKGIREDGQLLVSKEGHYAKQNCTDWAGLGSDNVREIRVDKNNEMDIGHLKEVMADCKREGKPIVSIICTLGTTDAFAIDPIDKVRELVDTYENAKGYPKPLIYGDAVIGWSWMAFGNYDFTENKLQFSPKALEILEENFKKIAPIVYADAIGIDFHKTGWSPYSSSLFMVRDKEKFSKVMERQLPAYLQDRTEYNPFKYSLETSRPGSYSMAGWAALRLFGREGFQVMLGRIIEVGLFFRNIIEKEKTLVCVNPDNYGFVTLFRVYPKHVNAEEQYQKELHNPENKEELKAYNILQQRVANKLFEIMREPTKKIEGWESPPYTSFTSGFRPPAYSPEEKDGQMHIYALKAFPMSPNSNELSMLIVRNYVLKIRDIVIEEMLKEKEFSGNRTFVDEPEEKEAALGTHNWFGENRAISEKYLLSSEKVEHKVVHSENVDEGEELSIIDIFSKIPVCAHLTHFELEELSTLGKSLQVSKNTILFSEGDLADKVYLILRGKVEVFKKDEKENEVKLAEFGRGNFFGEMSLFESGVRSAAVRALEDCEFYIVDGNQFLNAVLG